jgi:hypothetical protein
MIAQRPCHGGGSLTAIAVPGLSRWAPPDEHVKRSAVVHEIAFVVVGEPDPDLPSAESRRQGGRVPGVSEPGCEGQTAVEVPGVTEPDKLI